ncbi:MULTISPECIES: hypothetical protein [Winogradskyella]|uniref:Uncharacterized protein n=1 Tax=Winogradskyella ouciana TaxID=2608631 RepID=A0A7K1GIN9_9FLAO|nr:MULTISPECIES: hypothetical protein [Winogradskyella]MBO6879179.1 hypothetical protein [Winogradskyella sp.]MTE28109.1 hypothetical protein [Winogradskyella ouciana]
MQNKNEEQNPKTFVITEKGSLGLLAYGDIGLREWRKVKQNVTNKNNE